ncbi:membrane protein [Azorhizobium oxalatiphilum]|uniref:Membrane protein n=1 Tax=Azorhizobium oxalatiphilum TaxID=980631 RepID=A0A917FFX5_9HYPH|nr:hypothetical protein [Azorhizobium oxalatiphilum]GGF81413.1 membrane protein [Azorhizobium oxalatiphilum]
MFDVTTLVGFHTWLSLIAIASGVVVVVGLLRSRTMTGWSDLFLATAFGTSATGFLFPFNGLLPSHITGMVALLVLALTGPARYSCHLEGAWRWIYAAGVVASLYLLVFVGVAQAFGKIPALHALAPTQSEAPFAIAQLVVLVLFIVLGIKAARAFHPPETLPDLRPAGFH